MLIFGVVLVILIMVSGDDWLEREERLMNIW